MSADSNQRIASQRLQFRRLIRLRPFEVETPEGRASERHRRIVLSALASALAKIISVATMLISVPLTLNYLGPERYGMWMTISSLAAILAFADLGIGNGMLNAIAAAHGRDDRSAILGYVSSGFFALSLVSACLLCLFAAAYRFMPWATVFNVQNDIARQEVGPAVAVFFVCFAIAIPLAIVQRVQMAMQRSFLSSLWQCLASTLGLICVLIAIRQEAGLPWLVLAFVGAPLVVYALNSAIFFGRMQPEIAPARTAITRLATTQLMRTGGLFVVLQLVSAVAYASDSLVIAQLLGASAVANYSVPERMFGLIPMVLAMVLAPLWPAYGEAISRGDVAWVRHTLRRSVAIAVTASSVFSFTLVLLGPWLLEWWVGKAVVTSMSLLIGLAVWKTIEAGASSLAVFLNGANIIRTQLIISLITMTVAISLKLLLVPIFGVSGAVWATIIAFTTCALIPYGLILPKILHKVYLANSKHVQISQCLNLK